MTMRRERLKMSPVQGGEWTHQRGDSYLVTGVDRLGRRFRMGASNWVQASGINVWQGSRWLIRDGHRYLIQRVYN